MPEPTRRPSAEPRHRLPKSSFARIRLEGEPLTDLQGTPKRARCLLAEVKIPDS